MDRFSNHDDAERGLAALRTGVTNRHDLGLTTWRSRPPRGSQVPFVVIPVALVLLAILASLGVIPTATNGAVLPIGLETTSVVVLAFPPMWVLWKAVQDDGQVNWVETAAMVFVFGIVVFLLAVHG